MGKKMQARAQEAVDGVKETADKVTGKGDLRAKSKAERGETKRK
ncbi:hypothetical protein [Streptomyces sp. NPDC056670]